MTVSSAIASLLSAIHGLATPDEWVETHKNTLRRILREKMPNGSGFDNGTELDLEKSTPEKLVFHTSFHHMNDGGFYNGWTEHIVTVRSTFTGPKITVRGGSREMQDYVATAFFDALEVGYDG